MRALVLTVCIAMFPVGAPAGAVDRARITDKLGFAEAAVAACPDLELNAGGILELVRELDADDQAALAAGLRAIDRERELRARLFALLGDKSCDAALDFEAKLGIDIFTEGQNTQ